MGNPRVRWSSRVRARLAVGLGMLMLAAELSAGCGGGGMTGPLVPGTPGMASRCRIGASQTSVLVTEWPPGEKANLESMVSDTAIAVEFSGCSMRLLPQCRLGGRYYWQRTTPSSDRIEINSEQELYAKLPLGAVSLSGELKRAGSLSVETTVAGQLRLYEFTAPETPSTNECARATHIISGVSLGAFALHAGGSAEAGVSADATRVGVGARGSRSAKVVRYAGNSDDCYQGGEEAAHPGCASPIQVFLAAIPGRAEEEGPAGSVKADFVSGDGGVRWDVYVDDEATCTTPCARWVDPNRPLFLRSRESRPSKLQVSRIDPGMGPVQVVARPTNKGKLATGITFTALGGMGIITGITLASVGCSSDERDGLCKPGIYTGIPSAIVTAGAIWLILDSLPKLRVRPIFPHTTLSVGPGGIAGSF